MRLPSVRYACEFLKHGTCIGHWGCHEQRLLTVPLPCLDTGPCCEFCRGNTLSRRARHWYFATAIIPIQHELAATFGAVFWELFKLIPHERYSAEFITEDVEQLWRRSVTPSPPDCLRRGEPLPRVSTPCPVPEAQRLPPMVAWGPDIERSFLRTQIFELELHGSGPDGNESHSQEAQGKENRNLFEGIGDPQLTCHS